MSKIVQLFTSKNSLGQVKEVLNYLMDKMGITVSQLSKNTGLAGTTIKRICTDPDSNPTMTSITKLADFFSITPDQLMGITPLEQEHFSYNPNFEKWSKIPIITLKQTIAWPENIEEISASADFQYILTDVDVNEYAFAIILQDDSLEPKFSDGTILIVNTEKTPQNKDIILLLDKNKKYPYFRRCFVDGPDLYVKPINLELYNTTLLSDTDFRILGVVVQAKSNFI